MSRERRWGRWAAWLLVAAVGLMAGSCAWFRPAPYDDYVGPPPRPGPETGAPAATTQPATTRPAIIPATGPLAITLDEAILLGLENNQGLVVQRYGPKIQATSEEQQRAVFDPVATAGVSGSLQGVRRTGVSVSDSTTRQLSVNAGVSESLPTGTDITLSASTSKSHTDPWSDQASTRLGLTVTQALLQGFGLDVNLASLRQARLDILVSEYELRGFAEQLVAQIAETYWTYALAQRQIEIVTDSLKLAERQLNETGERIKIGKLAETERASAQAEVALRSEALIDARSALDVARLQFLRLLNPPGEDLWRRGIVLRDHPTIPDLTLDDVDTHVAIALRMRPDLNQARLGIQRGDLEVVKTRNGLLPVLDLFMTLGKTGYAESFGGSVRDLDGKSYDASVGLNFRFPPLNRDARARHRRSILSREQALESLRNLQQLANVDVRSAYVEVRRTKEQVAATAVTRKFQEETLRAETEKYQVGKSTSFLVARAQRDLLSAQIAEIQAVVGHIRAIIELHRLEGSLLERRGLLAPGVEPVDLDRPAWK